MPHSQRLGRCTRAYVKSKRNGGFPPYSVEKVGGAIVWTLLRDRRERVLGRSGRHGPSHRDDLRHFPQVLGCGGEVELVSCAIGSSQAQAIQLQDALEVGKQHFDLLALAAWHEIRVGGGDIAGEALLRSLDHPSLGGHFGLPHRSRGLDIDDHRVIQVDQIVGAVCVEGGLARCRGPARRRVGEVDPLKRDRRCAAERGIVQHVQILSDGAADRIGWQALLTGHRSLTMDIGSDQATVRSPIIGSLRLPGQSESAFNTTSSMSFQHNKGAKRSMACLHPSSDQPPVAQQRFFLGRATAKSDERGHRIAAVARC